MLMALLLALPLATEATLVPSSESFSFASVSLTEVAAAAPAMPLEQFWKLVQEIDWPHHSEREQRQARSAWLRARVSMADALAAGNRARQLQSELQRRIETWEKRKGGSIGLGDDLFGDLCAHIVGLGKAEYQRVSSNPALAKARATSGDFRENFNYVFSAARDLYPRAELIQSVRQSLHPRPFSAQPPWVDRQPVEHPRFGLGFVFKETRDSWRVIFEGGDLILK
jgi:hypothetical protein